LLCRGLLRRPRLAELFTITPPASTANWGVMEPDGTDAPCAPFAGERCFATVCCRTSTSVLTSQSGYSAALGRHVHKPRNLGRTFVDLPLFQH
jgi:hypothetical protein